MTDSFGADDNSGSGGLQNDMPGIGNAPPSPGHVPSALGGLAGIVKQMFSGGPAPRPAPMGRSPWQNPGQSQIPNMPQNPRRWDSSTASLAVPQGSMQPPARFTPFIGSQPTGNWRNWGQAESFPNLPQSFELPGITQRLAKFFSSPGQGGGGSTALLALGMGKYADQYMKAVMQGQEFAAKMWKEKWLQHSMELQEQQEQRHTSIADIIARYATEAGTDDPKKLIDYSIKGVSLRDALYDNALKTNDTDITGMLEDGVSVDKIMRYQDFRDANLKDLQKVNAKAQEQDAEDNAEREAAGLPPKEATAGGGSPLSLGRQATPPAGGPISQGGPAPTPTQTQQQQDQGGALLPYQEDGNNVFKGEQNINSMPKAIRPDVQNWAAQQGQKFDQVKNDIASGKIKQEDIPTALDKIMPGAGDDYINTRDGAPLPTGVAGRSPYWQGIKSMIPGFNPTTQQATLRDFATSGKSGTRLTAGNRMGEAAITVLEELKKIPEGESVPQYVIDQWVSSGVTGDPKWSNLFTALNTYMQEAQSLQSNTGRFFETEMQEQRRNVRLTEGPRAIRGILKIDAENSVNLVEQLRDNYHRGSRRTDDPPTYDPQRVDILKALTNLDENTGLRDIPKERLPEPLQKVWPGTGGGGGSDNGGKVHNWKDYFQ